MPEPRRTPEPARQGAAGRGLDAESLGVLARCRRVLVIGCPGAGKSRLSRALGPLLSLPVTHLDDVYWREDGSARDRGDFDARLASLLGGERWLLDGHYARTLPRRLRAADGVVFLDLPRRSCLLGVLQRALFQRDRPALDAPFLRKVWRFRADERVATLRALDEAGIHVVVQLRRRADARDLLVGLGALRDRAAHRAR